MKLTVGDSLHPRRPNDHREYRPGLADPSRLSGAHKKQPFAGVDRRRLASVRAKEEEGGMDWSNLTSGPPGPTVSDPAPVHVGEVEAHFHITLRRVRAYSKHFLFGFYLNNRF